MSWDVWAKVEEPNYAIGPKLKIGSVVKFSLEPQPGVGFGVGGIAEL
jgi:hypothetical protein